MVLETDVAQDHDSVAGLDRIDHGDVSLYVAFLLKTLLSLEYGRRRKVHPGCQLFSGQLGVLLQFAQNQDICPV